MFKEVKKESLVYGGKCSEMKVRLNHLLLFFNSTLSRKYFSGKDSSVVLFYDEDTKVLVFIPCKDNTENSFKVGRAYTKGKIRFGYLPVRSISATLHFKGFLDNRTVTVTETKHKLSGVEMEAFAVFLKGKK